MAIERMVYVTCDRCLTPAELGDNAFEARIYAQREGFIRLAKERLDLCLPRMCGGTWGAGPRQTTPKDEAGDP